MRQKITIKTLLAKKENNIPITMLTAYDAYTASLLDDAGIDIILVGDSYATTMLGYDTTLPVTMEEMLSITGAVSRGVRHAMIIADMPFMSYQESPGKAHINAGRFLKEAGAHAVKLEHSGNIEHIIKSIIDIDIPVMGHIGLTPQSIHRMGGYYTHGKTHETAQRLVDEAIRLERLGIFALVLEGIALETAQKITETLTIPTIGIGSGQHCNGQVQVLHDLLGYSAYIPRHAKQYTNLSETVRTVTRQYISDVQNKIFPDEKQSVHTITTADIHKLQ